MGQEKQECMHTSIANPKSNFVRIMTHDARALDFLLQWKIDGKQISRTIF
jgi:hypothetical protein